MPDVARDGNLGEGAPRCSILEYYTVHVTQMVPDRSSKLSQPDSLRLQCEQRETHVKVSEELSEDSTDKGAGWLEQAMTRSRSELLSQVALQCGPRESQIPENRGSRELCEATLDEARVWRVSMQPANVSAGPD